MIVSGDEGRILPKKFQKAITSALKGASDNTATDRDALVSEAFVHLFVETVGHYDDHWSVENDEQVFQRKNFVRDVSSKSIRSFLAWFVETQMFEQFLRERTQVDEEGGARPRSPATNPVFIVVFVFAFADPFRDLVREHREEMERQGFRRNMLDVGRKFKNFILESGTLASLRRVTEFNVHVSMIDFFR